MGFLIKREKARDYMLLVVVSFVLTVAVIRIFLHMTSYPQIAFWNLHIAHVLWGGMALFIGSVMLLIFSNPHIHRWSAILTGVGAGLFIDEIGKFVTKNNDYFFLGALPLIYVSFLLIFFVYVYVSKRKHEGPREQFYDVLDDFKDILDADLDPSEKNAMQSKLKSLSESSDKKCIRDFAKAMLTYLDSVDYAKEAKKNPFYETLIKARELIKRQTKMHKILFFLLLLMLTINSVEMISTGITLGIGALQSPEPLVPFVQEFMRENFPRVETTNLDVIMLVVQSVIQFLVGTIIIAGIATLMLKQKKGLKLVSFALAFSLCSTDVIMLYYHQFAQLIPITIKLITLGYIVLYDKLYHENIYIGLVPKNPQQKEKTQTDTQTSK